MTDLKGKTIRLYEPGSVFSAVTLDSSGIDSAYHAYFQGYATPRHGIWPTFLSLEHSSTGSGPLTFTINQGVTILHWCDSNFFRANYRGGYDFNTGYASGPIVSRLQNPSLFLEFDRNSNSSWMLGWAHQSNGQLISSDTDAALFTRFNKGSNNPQSDAQDFASMGWDYYWARYTRDYTGFGYSAEYRYHIRQGSEFSKSTPGFGSRDRIEDTSFFDTKPHLRILDVDGFTVSLEKSFPYAGRVMSRFVFKASLTTPEWTSPELWGGSIRPMKWPKDFYVAYGGKIKVFFDYMHGRMSTLARFDDGDQFKVNFGVIVPSLPNEGYNLDRLLKWR
jgi:hypothetical protein